MSIFSYLKSSQRAFLLGLLTFSLIFPSVERVQGQSNTNVLSNQIPSKWQFSPPSKLGVPTNREAAATRGCKTNGNLLALTPDPIKGLTASATPTLYWYLPQTEAAAVEFSLRNDQDQEIYKARYLLPENTNKTNQSGTIMGVELTSIKNFPGLAINQEYVWEVTLICDLDNPTQEKGVIGIIERITPTQEWEDRLQNLSQESERLGLYIDGNLWYETVDTMIKLRRENPDNPEIKSAWDKLMDSVNLPTI